MTSQQSSDSPKTNPTPADLRARSIRGGAGALIGCFAGGLIGWLIDSAITSDPYAGVRVGAFLGALLCGVGFGSGTGWLGMGLMLSMVVCSVAGVAIGFALWYPDPNSFVDLIPAGVGGIVGAFIGLALPALLLQRRQKGDSRQAEPDTKPDHGGK